MHRMKFLGCVGVSAAALTAMLPAIARADDEIVVTAQRRSENIQKVPVTVTAVTGQQLKDLAIFRIEDVQKLSPGLSLESSGASGSRAQLRGVGFDTDASASPAVDIYMNETPVDANYALQAIYDIGQIEVLRGPQGTLRGRPSPAGAVTLTTRRADLQNYAASISTSASDQSALNLQGMVNVPLIKDVLAVRVAGMYNEDDINGVKSVNGGGKQNRDTESYRGSVRWTPTVRLDVNFAYQHLKTDGNLLTQVEGPGAGYNGPAIQPDDRLAVTEGPGTVWQRTDLFTLNVAYDLDAAQLIYNGAHQSNKFSMSPTDIDYTNAVIGYTQDQLVDAKARVDTHELRLQSKEPFKNFDYTLGLWYQKNRQNTVAVTPTPLFGSFGFAPVGPADPDYVIGAVATIPTREKNTAIYGNLTYHFSDKTSLSVGARSLKADIERNDIVDVGSAIVSFPLAFPCSFAGATDSAKFGAGFCDLSIPASNFANVNKKTYNEWVYQASLKHNFTDAFMGYVTYGHSFRPPGNTVAVSSPVARDLVFAANRPEESDSFELGVRSEWFDSRLRVNASLYHQDFKNYIGRFNDIPYLDTPTASVQMAYGFTYPGDAKVDGLELEFNYDITSNWYVNLTGAASDGHYDGAVVPCRDTNLDGTPDNGDVNLLSPGDFTADLNGDGIPDGVLYCKTNGAISTTPDWQATLQSEYKFPLFGNEGYVRGLYAYQPSNNNVQPDFTRKAYGLLNLYAGIRGVEKNWEVGLWAKNALNEEVVLSRDSYQTGVYSLFSPGYRTIQYTAPQEFGVTVRYAFGE